MGERTASPSAPFERWPIQVFHPDYGFAWYSSAHKALVTQTHVTHARPAGGHVLSDWIDAALREDAAGVEAAGGLFLLHDFRSLVGYDAETRTIVNDRIRARKPDYARRIIIVVRPKPIWRMAMHVTDLTLALLGIPPAKVTGNIVRAAAELEAFVFDSKPPPWLVAV
jgi:hypothetical protein